MFTCEGLTYSDALKLIDKLKEQDIEANITTGGVSVVCLPEQINMAQQIAKASGASFSPGYTSIQETFLLRNGSFEHVEQVTNNARSIIQEWK
jgi:hypothetical protein